MDEEEEYFNSRVPVIHEDRKHHKTQNKQVLLNLGIFALLTAVSSLLFMGWLAKKTRTQQNILPFHNPLDRTQLLCPLNTSFDTTRFSCMACSNNCEHCYHEYEQRCLQCVHPYKLQQNECVEECVSVDGVCVNELEPSLFNYSVENLGTELRVNQLFQVEIHNQQQEHVYIVFPPLGQSFNYFYSTVNFFQLAKQLNGTIYIFSTPYTEVLQIQEVQEDDELPEQFRYVERVFQYVNESLISNVKSINIVALGDMLFFAHELSTLIVRSGLNVNTTVYLLQNSEIQLQESLNLSYLRLQHLLAYIDQGWDISHKENKTNLIAENVDDLSTILQEFLQKMNFNSLIKPSYNMKVDVVVLSEKGCRDIRQLYDDGFNAKEFKQIFLDSGNLQILFSKLIMLNRNS